MGQSNIEWTDITWNPMRGCRRVSPGCENCYAERQAIRHAGLGRPYNGLVRLSKGGPRWTGDSRFVVKKLAEPLTWKGHHRVFVDSMSDLFYEGFHDDEIAAVFGVMAACPQHTFQVLTKRPERAREWFKRASAEHVGGLAAFYLASQTVARSRQWPLPNVWLGVSVEDQQRADERIPELLATPAAVRFVSAEPLLGRVNICQVPDTATRPQEFSARYTPLGDLDWVIVGGESGPGARQFNVGWARLLVETCREAGVACFVKQLGANVIDANDGRFAPCAWDDEEPNAWPDPTEIQENPNGFREEYQGAPVRVLLSDRKGGDPEEWPRDLRVRQFPTPRPSIGQAKEEVPPAGHQETPGIPGR